MVELARGAELQAWIDDFLDYLFRTWEALPDNAAESVEWDELDRLDFELEFVIPEDRLHQLQGWAAQGLLTPEQCERYDQLLKLVAQNRPILEQMLAP